MEKHITDHISSLVDTLPINLAFSNWTVHAGQTQNKQGVSSLELSKMSVRQPRNRHQGHGGRAPAQVQASDYESDVHTHHAPPPTRTNTDLNLSVLRRYKPSIRTILSIAANAVVYVFTPSSQQWEKSGIEGTLFVCEQEPSDLSGAENYCIIVLNRRGLENLILDLWQAQDVERMDDLLILRFPDPDCHDVEKVMGLWIHEDKHDTREVNAGQIITCWDKAKAAKLHDAELAAKRLIFDDQQSAAVGGVTGTGPVAGRRISLSNLFSQKVTQ